MAKDQKKYTWEFKQQLVALYIHLAEKRIPMIMHVSNPSTL